jgi:hypothetical protein
MKCPKCGGDNADDAAYCGLCYVPFGKVKKAAAAGVPPAIYVADSAPAESSEGESGGGFGISKFAVLIAVCAIAFGVYKFRSADSGVHAPDALYTAISGGAWPSSGTGKPAVIVFWITNCPYAARAMSVLNDIRREYPVSEVDVVGFYLNKIDPQELTRIGSMMNYQATLLPAQDPPELVWSLDSAFSLKGAGRAIYVVNRSGSISSVDASDLGVPDSDIVSRVIKLVGKAL